MVYSLLRTYLETVSQMHINRFQRPGRMRGFTLIEIMVVVVIIGLLVAIVAPNVMGRLTQAEIQAAEADIKQLSSSLNFFRMDYRRYPTEDEGLEILLGKEEVDGKPGSQILQSMPEDPWGNPYYYVYPGAHGQDFDIYSLGADGEEGGEGANADIVSWELT
jgi:general secretion pathway protein G